MEVPMGNYLEMADKRRVEALLELGWSYRRVQRETGVDRKTVARYDPGRQPKSARVSTGPAANAARVSTGSVSACEPYRQIIEAAAAKGLSAQRIWQDLTADYHFSHQYASVKRFVRRIRRHRPEVTAVMEHPPGEEGQVDFFKGPVSRTGVELGEQENARRSWHNMTPGLGLFPDVARWTGCKL
jgi:transposase